MLRRVLWSCLALGLLLWVAFNAYQAHISLGGGLQEWEVGNMVARAIMAAIVFGSFALLPWLCVVLAVRLASEPLGKGVVWLVLTLTVMAVLAATGLGVGLLLLMSFQC